MIHKILASEKLMKFRTSINVREVRELDEIRTRIQRDLVICHNIRAPTWLHLKKLLT